MFTTLSKSSIKKIWLVSFCLTGALWGMKQEKENGLKPKEFAIEEPHSNRTFRKLFMGKHTYLAEQQCFGHPTDEKELPKWHISFFWHNVLTGELIDELIAVKPHYPIGSIVAETTLGEDNPHILIMDYDRPGKVDLINMRNDNERPFENPCRKGERLNPDQDAPISNDLKFILLNLTNELHPTEIPVLFRWNDDKEIYEIVARLKVEQRFGNFNIKPTFSHDGKFLMMTPMVRKPSRIYDTETGKLFASVKIPRLRFVKNYQYIFNDKNLYDFNLNRLLELAQNGEVYDLTLENDLKAVFYLFCKKNKIYLNKQKKNEEENQSVELILPKILKGEGHKLLSQTKSHAVVLPDAGKDDAHNKVYVYEIPQNLEVKKENNNKK